MALHFLNNKLFFLFVLIFISCTSKKTNDKQNNKSLNDTNHSLENKTIISGITDDPKAFESLNLLDYSYLFIGNNVNTSKQIKGDSIHLELDSLKQPGIMRLYAIGDSTRYNMRVFVTPGDSIFIKMKSKKVEFSGKNVDHYNFFKYLKDLDLDEFYFEGDLMSYKNKCKEAFNKKNKFLLDYAVNCKVSDDFRKTIKADIKYEYLNNLIILKEKNKYSKNIFKLLKDKSFHSLNKGFDISDYFKSIDLKDFQRNDLLNNHFFKESFINYTQYYFIGNEYDNFSNEKLLIEKEFILSNFNGELQEFAMVRLINNYYKNLVNENIDDLMILINEYKCNFSNISYLNAVEKIENRLKIINNKLPDIVLKSELITPANDTIFFEDIVGIQDKIVVIDFWASWCGPCISEIKKGANLRKKLSKVQWVNLSIDSDKDKWLNSLKKLDKFNQHSEQYLVINKKMSELTHYFKLSDIPRYIVLNNKMEVISENAPRPSDSLNFLELIQKFNTQKQ